VAAQPSRHGIGNAIGLGVQPNSGNAAEINGALDLRAGLDTAQVMAHDQRS
jgi:hypothetical protein